MSESLYELKDLLSEELEKLDKMFPVDEHLNLNNYVSDKVNTQNEKSETGNESEKSEKSNKNKETDVTLESNNQEHYENSKMNETVETIESLVHMSLPDALQKQLSEYLESQQPSESNDSNNKKNTIQNIENGNFIYNFTNGLLLSLIVLEFYNIFFDFNKSSFYIAFLNVFLFYFYNATSDVMVETQSNVLNYCNKYYTRCLSNIKTKWNTFFQKFMNYCFSKQTQMILNFACNLMKTSLYNKYMYHKNKLLNPPLLTQTRTEDVYCLSFYLNGERYKIPIVVNKSGLDKNEPPLMVLDHNEQDITQNILEFMGPNYDFYGMCLRPKHFGQKNLNFMLDDGSEMNILENDMIVL